MTKKHRISAACREFKVEQVSKTRLHTVKELKIVGDHHDILSAICACDADRAYALMAAHLTRFEIDEKLIKNEYPEYFVN